MNKSTLAHKILHQDLEYFKILFEKGKLREMNVAANRYLEDCIFFDNYLLSIPGVIIKDMVLDYQNIYSNEKKIPINTINAHGFNLIFYIEKNLENINEVKLWEEYQKYSVNINQFLQNEDEKVYLKNREFGNFTFKYLIDFVEKNRKYLFIENNNLINGILNIIVRVIRNHDCSIKQNMIYIYFKTLYRFYGYLYQMTYINKQSESLNLLKKEIDPLLDFIIKFSRNEEINYKIFDQTIWKIVRKWRELYILFMNFETPYSKKEPIVIPKTVIENAVEKYLKEKNQEES